MNDRKDHSEGDLNLSPNRVHWQREHIDGKTRALLEEDARYFLHQSLSTPCLNALRSCSGSEMEDMAGRRILDFHGNSLHQVGYGNHRVLEAIRAQLETLPFCPRRYTNEPAVALAKKLAELAPGTLSKSLFAPGGTTAVGMALKLARAATGRFKTISMWDSFHGASLDAISLSGEALFRSNIGPLLPGASHVPPADPDRCPWNPAGNCGACGLKCAGYIEYVMEREGDVAAVVAEPIRNTVVSLPPEGYWQAVRKICDRHGALLIFDETAVCLGRTGRMFACEHYGVVPDILTLGKGLGGGVFPMAALVAREDLDIAAHTAIGHYTHEKNPVGCAAALAAISFIEEEGLLERSRALGHHLGKELLEAGRRNAALGNARGLGLLWSVPVLRRDGSRLPDPETADALMYACLTRGLSFKVSAGNMLSLIPPLTITEADLDRAIAIIESGLAEVTGGQP
jgi:4-aminobutyrate aminotransferase